MTIPIATTRQRSSTSSPGFLCARRKFVLSMVVAAAVLLLAAVKGGPTMHRWHFSMMPGLSEAPWILLLVVLAILAVEAIRSVARLEFFGGREVLNLDPLDELLVHGKINLKITRKPKKNTSTPTRILIRKYRVP
jgi:hypothetical protein